jgi:hypothetical protein
MLESLIVIYMFGLLTALTLIIGISAWRQGRR